MITLESAIDLLHNEIEMKYIYGVDDLFRSGQIIEVPQGRWYEKEAFCERTAHTYLYAHARARWAGCSDSGEHRSASVKARRHYLIDWRPKSMRTPWRVSTTGRMQEPSLQRPQLHLHLQQWVENKLIVQFTLATWLHRLVERTRSASESKAAEVFSHMALPVPALSCLPRGRFGFVVWLVGHQIHWNESPPGADVRSEAAHMPKYYCTLCQPSTAKSTQTHFIKYEGSVSEANHRFY
jgi:hypothetical protein